MRRSRIVLSTGARERQPGAVAGTALDQAWAAKRLADQDPAHALPAAEQAVRRARRDGDLAALAVAERACGIALMYTGDQDSAIRHLRRAVAGGQRAGDRVLAAEARMTLAFVLNQRGRSAPALREIDLALTALQSAALQSAAPESDSRESDSEAGGTGSGAIEGQVAAARSQRALLQQLNGRSAAALADYQAAVPVLRAGGDLLTLQRVLVNRGILLTQLYEFDAAAADLHEAMRLCQRLGRDLAAGIIDANLGFLAMVRGDVPAALDHLDAAERRIAAHGAQLGPVFQDRAELLLSVRLLGEARAEADRAVRAYQRDNRQLNVPEARLVLAQAAQLDGDPATALAQARRAADEFRRQGRPAWTALARLTVLRIRLAAGEPVRVRAGEVDGLLGALAAAGWPAAEQDARLAAARLALDRGRTAEGRRLLGLASLPARRRAPAALRARGWYAAALLRLSEGDPDAAARAARAGVRLLHEYGAALGATDLRVHAAGLRTELTDLGLRVAMTAGRPERVFEWAERGRASRFRYRPVRPPDDPEMARLLAELRATAVEINRQRLADRPTGRLVAAQVALERQVRDRSRRSRTDPRRRPADPVPADPVPAGALAAALGERALLEFAVLDGVLFGLSIVDGRLRLRRLAAVAEVAHLLERLPFALQRLLRTDAATQGAALRLLRHTAARLDSLLLRPYPELAGRELVLVPTGPLHSLPWSVLPSCAGRPVTVAPSATLWHATSALAAAPAPVAVAAGPRLPAGDAEARAVAAVHRTTALVGDAATAGAVLSALDGAGLAHLAAHGRLSRDNPLFSDLLFADGPLLGYDLERLPRVPHTVVLAACDAGRSLVTAGDELLGLAAAFVGRGAATIVASVVPVADAGTRPLMESFHCGLIAGRPPAVALADAQHRLAAQDPVNLAATAGFVCLGAGFAAAPLPERA
jgi:tetratricopeptide (TPR) repeat protein